MVTILWVIAGLVSWTLGALLCMMAICATRPREAIPHGIVAFGLVMLLWPVLALLELILEIRARITGRKGEQR